MVKNRARLAILNTLLAFPTINGKDWRAHYFDSHPKVGDLVSLCAAPVSKWYLSWIIEIDRPNPKGDGRYLLESVETGELCWWSNVGLNVYIGESLDASWRWTDQQYKFIDRWARVFREQGAYMTRRGPATFSDPHQVTLSVREAHNFGDDQFLYSKTFPDFRKVTIRDLTAFYLEGDAARATRLPALKAKREKEKRKKEGGNAGGNQ